MFKLVQNIIVHITTTTYTYILHYVRDQASVRLGYHIHSFVITVSQDKTTFVTLPNENIFRVRCLHSFLRYLSYSFPFTSLWLRREGEERRIGGYFTTFFPFFFAAYGNNLPARFLQHETVGSSCAEYEVSYSGNVTPCSMVHV